ncbi:tetraspanin-5 [Octopus bimaculoides]|uniref:Tetraspanin n=1 Tax=Octopus bimaculoides TaxID=37653 RepID=A0A0L8GVI0_OCTBM|nr:tetraspanin-5 [Octopus bimaculoides]XP_014777725.1 tetraspanin-5 [Octopus bimaculoides]|eukprot:XP_014777724.1 PREDICTED: tetraspanin-5-like [Octopus bimaculoides]
MTLFSQKMIERLWRSNSIGTTKFVERQKQYEEKSEISLCVKYTLFSLNFLSCAIITCGFTGYAIHNSLTTAKQYPLERYWHLNKILFVLAGITFVISLFGIIGSLREHLKSLSVYKYLVFITLFAEVIFCVILLIYIYVPTSRYNIEFFPKGSFSSDMQNYGDFDGFAKNRVNSLQETFHCCGLSDNDEAYMDWRTSEQFKCDNSKSWNNLACTVPSSCCRLTKLNNVSCVDDVLRKRPIDVQDKIYTQGCLKGFHTWVEINGVSIIGIMFGIILPQIVLLVIATILMNQIIRQLAKWESSDTSSITSC